MNPQPTTKAMSSRERFRETMSYGKPDRVPYFEEGIRKDVERLFGFAGAETLTGWIRVEG